MEGGGKEEKSVPVGVVRAMVMTITHCLKCMLCGGGGEQRLSVGVIGHLMR